MVLTLQQGMDLVFFARAVVESKITGKTLYLPVSLNGLTDRDETYVLLYRDGFLRGASGSSNRRHSIPTQVNRAALYAAFHDDRFPMLREEDLSRVTFEVSVISHTKLLEAREPREYLRKILIGRDGLIVERGKSRGLMLPQVPMNQEWNNEEFLWHTCVKAGLMPDEWKRKGARVSTFRARIFAEETPRGRIIERRLI